MQRSLQQLVAGFALLAAIAWWVTARVNVSHSIRDFFLGEPESGTLSEASPEEQEKKFMARVLAELPSPPAEHSPELAELLSRLKLLENIPSILLQAVKRDRDTPTGQTPLPWGEEELAALRDYQDKFAEAWETFLSGPPPDWEKFPDSALFFRSHFPSMDREFEDIFNYGLYFPGRPESWNHPPEDHPEFFLRLFRQAGTLGTLRFGSFSGWGYTDMVFLSRMSEKTLRGADYFFPPQSQDPEDLLPLTLLPPTINSLREGLKTDRAVFLRSADYLETLPATTPADMALTRLLGNKGDAEWFARHVGQPQNTRDLAAILRQGAEQIALLEQKTYLSGPAWRQWLSGDVDLGLGPALKGSLNGMREFEKTRLEYQLSLAFLKASSAYRQAGQEGMRNIPDPASPGSFLSVSRTPEGLTLSSAYRREDGTNYSFTFQPAPAP